MQQMKTMNCIFLSPSVMKFAYQRTPSGRVRNCGVRDIARCWEQLETGNRVKTQVSLVGHEHAHQSYQAMKTSLERKPILLNLDKTTWGHLQVYTIPYVDNWAQKKGSSGFHDNGSRIKGLSSSTSLVGASIGARDDT
jgi:hypothetical protein